jgi:hypothetical protein
MLKSLISFFTDDSTKYSFFKLYSKLTEWGARGYTPYEYELPEVITFPPEFWTKLIRLYKETRSDEHERAVSVFWVDGELVITPTTIGNRRMVQSNSEIKVIYGASKYKGYSERKILVNDKVYSTKDVSVSKVPKKIEIQYLFNLHTHPPHSSNGQTHYSFFSEIDLNSFLASKALITGMIGDRLWLLFKTNKTPAANTLKDAQINRNTLTNQLSLAVYEGEFKGKLRKLSS